MSVFSDRTRVSRSRGGGDFAVYADALVRRGDKRRVLALRQLINAEFLRPSDAITVWAAHQALSPAGLHSRVNPRRMRSAAR